MFLTVCMGSLCVLTTNILIPKEHTCISLNKATNIKSLFLACSFRKDYRKFVSAKPMFFIFSMFYGSFTSLILERFTIILFLKFLVKFMFLYTPFINPKNLYRFLACQIRKVLRMFTSANTIFISFQG